MIVDYFSHLDCQKTKVIVIFGRNAFKSGDLVSSKGGEPFSPPLCKLTLALRLPKKWLPTSYLAETKMFQQKNNQKVVCNMCN